MPLTGTDPLLATKMFNSVKSKLEAKLGQSAIQADMLQAICEAISEIIVPHLVSNITLLVTPGIPVLTVGSPTTQTGATTAPGTGNIL